MKPKTIDIIRDLALKYEQHDLEVAHDLMTVAHQERPAGQLITKKLLDYKYRLNCESAEAIELNKCRPCCHHSNWISLLYSPPNKGEAGSNIIVLTFYLWFFHS